MTFQNFQLNFAINGKVGGRGEGKLRVLYSVPLWEMGLDLRGSETGSCPQVGKHRG